MKQILAIIFILVVAITFSCGQKTNNQGQNESVVEEIQTNSGKEGTMAPDFTAPVIDGTTFKLSDYQGKIVFLDFWTTWCVPCRKEVPGFIELHKKYYDKGIVIVGVSLDTGDISMVKEFAENSKMNYKVIQASQEVAKAYDNVTALPTAFLVDRNGKIVKKFVGYHDKEVFEEAFISLLDREKENVPDSTVVDSL